MSTVAPQRVDEPDTRERIDPDRPWLVIVHDDPVNLMDYVTWVFQRVFGYPKPKAHKLMLQVHNSGRAVVSSGPRERAELECHRLHGYGLWATIARSD